MHGQIPDRDVANPDELIGSRAIIQGASGAGKTYAIRRILEETHGLMQHLVLDVEDEMHTLRERFDYALIGGESADAPITVETAGAMARALLELRVSAIIQLNDVGLTAQRSIIAAFVSGLMSSPRALWHPVLVTLDEAHRYAPQSGTVASSEPLTNLATAGRKRPFGALFATQRLSMLSKDILGQCPNRVMGRVDQSLDRRAAADMLGFTLSSPDAKGMMTLKHEFWVVGPAFASEPKLHRFSKPVTTHLQPGKSNVATPATPQKVRAMLGNLAKLAAQAPEAQAADVTPKGRREATPAVAVDAAVEAARSAGWAEGWASCNSDKAEEYARGLNDGRRQAILEAQKTIDEALSELSEGTDREPEAEPARPVRAAAVAASNEARKMDKPSDDVQLGRPHQRILDALAWLESAGIKQPGRHQVGWAASYRADTGHFGNLLTDLSNAGMIERQSNGLSLTADGRAKAVAPPGKVTAEALLDRIRAKLGGPAVKLLDALATHYPASMERDALAEETGYRADTGHFGNLITELTGPEIAYRPRQGQVRLSDWVMLK